MEKDVLCGEGAGPKSQALSATMLGWHHTVDQAKACKQDEMKS